MRLFPNSQQQPPALRLAVLTVFTQTSDETARSLSRFNERDWRAQLHWLDASGLALYLLGHLQARDLAGLLPRSIQQRIEQNLIDNRERNAGLLAEAAEINRGLQREGVLFANLKGITLTPESVPDPGLRCQLDLDFMVEASHAGSARGVLERMGYTLDGISGDTWEFKVDHAEIAVLRDLYKSKPQRSVELHLVASDNTLSRLHIRTYAHTAFPVLSPVDLYVAQAFHLFKHLCSAFTRAAWLLEHYTHMQTRRGDEAFWRELAERIACDSHAKLAVGTVTRMIEQSLGCTCPSALTAMLYGAVPKPVHLWIELYGQQALLADFPGTKLYLLLMKELPRASGSEETHTSLLPRHAPPMITQARQGESLLSRLRRYRTQLAYILFRLRFHAVEGLRYMIESSRFRRLLTGLSH